MRFTRAIEEEVAEVAQEFKVPVLLHFQHNVYNFHIERFHKILEKFPKVNFIGHAQTWWSNIDKNSDQKTMYPLGKVVPGGITDRLLTDYPNMFGDLSAGSGLNALNRDQDFTRDFLARHQDKLSCMAAIAMTSSDVAQVARALRPSPPSENWPPARS